MSYCFAGGSFLYVVPDDGRAGMQDFVTILGYHGLVLQSRTPAPDRCGALYALKLLCRNVAVMQNLYIVLIGIMQIPW